MFFPPFFSCFLNNALIRPARYSLGVLHLERISCTVLTWGAAFGKNFLWLHAVQEAWQLLLVPAMSIGSHEKVVSAEMTRK